jgi:hypothetical protein
MVNSFIKISNAKSFVKIKKDIEIKILYFNGEEFKEVDTKTNEVDDYEDIIEFLTYKHGYYLVYTANKLTVMLKGSMDYRIFVLDKSNNDKDVISINVTKTDGDKVSIKSSQKYDKIFVFKNIPQDLIGFGEIENSKSSAPVNALNSFEKEGYICIVGAKNSSIKKKTYVSSIKKHSKVSTVVSSKVYSTNATKGNL